MSTLKSHKQTAEEAEQAQRAQDWFDSRPTPPMGKRPKKMGDGIFWIIILGALAGLIVGLTYFLGAFSAEFNWIERTLRFFAPLVGLAAGIVIGSALSFGIMAIYDRIVGMAPWNKYDSDVRFWELVGDEDLGQWVTTNFSVASKLSFIDHAYMDKFFAAQREEKPRAPKEYIDDELGDLERTLDNATPGPVSSLNLPSVRMFSRSAKRFAAIKQAKVQKGERFLMENRYPMKRSLGVNSAGWFSSSGINATEEAQIVRHVKNIYGKYGLDVTKCWIGWTGMSVGSGGNFESFVLVIRLA